MSTLSLQDVPNRPGVYIFRNAAGQVIYVGKAKSLRKRLATYFHPSRRITADPKLRSLINSIAGHETVVVRTESEALLLESRLVKQYQPFYNVELRDDKRFLLLAVDLSEPFPRLQLTRLKRDDGRLYFGPFPFTRALRETMTFLADFFGLRTCPGRTCSARRGRHCLKRHIQECAAPCAGTVTPEAYRDRVEGALRVLRGDLSTVRERLTERMREAAESQKFEEAAQLRDTLANLKAVVGAPVRTFEHSAGLAPQAAPAAAVLRLQTVLGLDRLPIRMECFDISNIGGRFAVGSKVVFSNGRPLRSEYRRYRIKTVEGANDFAMMEEVVSRRVRRALAEKTPLPDLLVVDGGAGQLSRAVLALQTHGVVLPVLGLAKQQEHIYLPGRELPLQLDRADAALKLLQALRDEAHRFGLAYHVALRRRRLTESLLDDIPGVGPARRQELLRHFGSVRAMAGRPPEEIAAAVPGVGPTLAQQILEHLRRCL